MWLSGCLGMNIGVETGDEALMSLQAKKGLNLEKLRWLRNEAKRIGLKLHFLLSIGMPQETKKSIIETYDLIQRFKPESLGITVITPYPGTPLYEDIKRQNLFVGSSDWERYVPHGATPLIRTKYLKTSYIKIIIQDKNIISQIR